MAEFLNLKDLRNDMIHNPNKYTDDQGNVSLIGEVTSTVCPSCYSEQRIEILDNGRGKCLKCKQQFALIEPDCPIKL